MARNQVEITLHYQIVRGEGAYGGKLNLTSTSQPNVEPVLVLDGDWAERFAMFFAPDEAKRAKQQAESAKDSDKHSGEPILVFNATFVSTPTAPHD